ncbi:MAG: twin-arginine translocase TatA/TatE family subunit [Chloroflexi bacterium]|nr:twin-arginine translocase TatA/TatE family subunit [Chloroflexota bacterium]
MEFISNFNGLELVFIVILAILLFGPEKIPEIAAKIGSWARTLRNISSQVMADLREESGFSDIAEDGEKISVSLNQTMTDMKSTVKTIQTPINALKETLQEQVAKDKPQQPKQEDTPETTVNESPESNRELLEKRLHMLEEHIHEIRSELATTDKEQTEGENG